MQRKLVLEFTKMSGAGNDFIVIDNRFYFFSDQELAGLARRFCARRIGVGADGLLALNEPADPAHHYHMRYYNADGSLGTMCGNGARCLARFARLSGIEAGEMVFESDAGLLRALVPAEAGAPVRIYFGPPQRYERGVALQGPARDAVDTAYAIWTGTEHLVCFVPAVAQVPVASLGPDLRADAALQPAGANVDFVQVVRSGAEGGEARLRVRTFEKGVEAETLACGTGAMASALVARFVGNIAVNEAAVEMAGGTLKVGFDLAGEAVTGLYLEGPAEVVYRGSVEV